MKPWWGDKNESICISAYNRAWPKVRAVKLFVVTVLLYLHAGILREVIRKLRIREGESFVQSHTAVKRELEFKTQNPTTP